MSIDIPFKPLLKCLMPLSVRHSARRATGATVKHIRAASHALRPNAWVVSGQERTQGRTLCLLYCGDDAQYRNYILQLAFQSGAEVKALGRRFLASLGSAAERNGADMLFVEHSRWSACAFQNDRNLCLPRWVESWLDLSQGIEHLKKNPAYKDALRLIRKYSYTYTVTRDPAALEHFFYTLYRPAISAIHGESAYIISHEYFQTLCSNADLLLVMQGQKAVAGVLIQYQGNDALMAYAGFKDGNTQYVRNGAAGAFYYFAPVWLHEHGFSRVCFGGSKSFLNDGVLRTKVHKGAYFTTRVFTPDERIYMSFRRDTTGVRDFLSSNPFVCYTEKKELTGALFANTEDLRRNADSIDMLLEPYRNYRGIERWLVYSFDADGPVSVRGSPVEIRPFPALIGR
jgi:hypothetical protein